jgi:inorganic phosphate transporter, PiT family
MVHWSSVIEQSCSNWRISGAGLVTRGTKAIVFPRVEKTLIFIVVSPMMGFVIAFILTISIMFLLRRNRPSFINKLFAKLQIGLSAFFPLTHGAYDGQKTMDVITALLISAGVSESKNFVAPVSIVLASAAAIAVGTFFGVMENRKDWLLGL